MCSVLFLVDYLGTVGYIISRALMLFSPFFVSWHVLVVRAALLVLLPQSLSSNVPINRFLRGTDGSDFFLPIFLSLHPIPRLLCLLARAFLLLGYHHIHIAPLLAPLSSTR